LLPQVREARVNLEENPRAVLFVICVAFLFYTAPVLAGAQNAPATTGLFEGHTDVGPVLHPGLVEYDPANQSYAVSGSGWDMWDADDEFHFTWKKVSDNVFLTADIAFANGTGNAHKKAVLMFRQDLDKDSAYVDVALHASGLTSLQYRLEKGGPTHEIQSDVAAPSRLRIVRQGDYVYLWLAGADGNFKLAGASIRIAFQGSLYAGIGVCSHDKDVVEKAIFAKVDLTTLPAPTGEAKLYSTLETVAIATADRRVIYVAPGRFEAPNWTRDGAAFLFNGDGHILRLPVSGTTPAVIDTGFANRCNNDHGISPDSKWLAISDQSQDDHRSLVYLVPIAGGTPRKITNNSPSYWHGWSPDGSTLAFVGQRNGDFDIYTIPIGGGQETRLTIAKGLDDGPEYSPDGKYIYFNSERTGIMQIWRMRADGSEQQQITSDDFNNWFPHISPDGKWMVFLAYEKDVTGHPENKNVRLRLMSLEDKRISVLATLFGGQGTMNVPSWSPDSKQLAFVSYELIQ
jgi:TolB protein